MFFVVVKKLRAVEGTSMALIGSKTLFKGLYFLASIQNAIMNNKFLTGSGRMKQIIAMGGGGFSMEPENLSLDQYIINQSIRPEVASRLFFADGER